MYKSHCSGKEVEAARQGPPCACKRKCFEKFRVKIWQVLLGVVRQECSPRVNSSEEGATAEAIREREADDSTLCFFRLCGEQLTVDMSSKVMHTYAD